MDFGRPNVEIGQKMANGQLLFLALQWHCGLIVLEYNVDTSYNYIKSILFLVHQSHIFIYIFIRA